VREIEAVDREVIEHSDAERRHAAKLQIDEQVDASDRADFVMFLDRNAEPRACPCSNRSTSPPLLNAVCLILPGE
jgi:hypothetical protein